MSMCLRGVKHCAAEMVLLFKRSRCEVDASFPRLLKQEYSRVNQLAHLKYHGITWTEAKYGSVQWHRSWKCWFLFLNIFHWTSSSSASIRDINATSFYPPARLSVLLLWASGISVEWKNHSLYFPLQGFVLLQTNEEMWGFAPNRSVRNSGSLLPDGGWTTAHSEVEEASSAIAGAILSVCCLFSLSAVGSTSLLFSIVCSRALQHLNE